MYSSVLAASTRLSRNQMGSLPSSSNSLGSTVWCYFTHKNGLRCALTAPCFSPHMNLHARASHIMSSVCYRHIGNGHHNLKVSLAHHLRTPLPYTRVYHSLFTRVIDHPPPSLPTSVSIFPACQPTSSKLSWVTAPTELCTSPLRFSGLPLSATSGLTQSGTLAHLLP